MNTEESIRYLRSVRENIWLPIKIGNVSVEIKMRAKDLIRVISQNDLSAEIRGADYTNRTYTFNPEKGLRVYLKETNGSLFTKDTA